MIQPIYVVISIYIYNHLYLYLWCIYVCVYIYTSSFDGILVCSKIGCLPKSRVLPWFIIISKVSFLRYLPLVYSQNRVFSAPQLGFRFPKSARDRGLSSIKRFCNLPDTQFLETHQCIKDVPWLQIYPTRPVISHATTPSWRSRSKQVRQRSFHQTPRAVENIIFYLDDSAWP